MNQFKWQCNVLLLSPMKKCNITAEKKVSKLIGFKQSHFKYLFLRLGTTLTSKTLAPHTIRILHVLSLNSLVNTRSKRHRIERAERSSTELLKPFSCAVDEE